MSEQTQLEVRPGFSFKKITPLLGNAFFALAVLLILCLVFRPEFRNPATLCMIARQVTCVGIIALGMTFVIAGGGIDLSVGSLFALTGVITVLSLDFLQAHPEILALTPANAFFVTLGVSLLTGAVGGALNGLLIVLCRIPPFIATLGTLSVFRSLTLHLAHSGSLPMPVSVSRIADPQIGRYQVASLVFLALTAFFAVLMSRTAYGRHVCATGANEKVARFAGIRTGAVRFMTYVLTGFCTGAAMVLFLGQLESVPNDAGNLYELDAIAAVVIGGTPMNGGKASLWGTLAGALILGIIFALLNFAGTASTLKDLVKGAIILFSVFIQRKEKTI